LFPKNIYENKSAGNGFNDLIKRHAMQHNGIKKKKKISYGGKRQLTEENKNPVARVWLQPGFEKWWCIETHPNSR
jgi:hypothetical protein